MFPNEAYWDETITEANTTIFAEKDNNYCFVIQEFSQNFFNLRYRGIDEPCIRAQEEVDDFLTFVSEVKTLTDGLRQKISYLEDDLNTI